MNWAGQRNRLLGKAPTMTLDDVCAALRERDVQLWIEDGGLLTEPALTTDDPLVTGIEMHEAALTEMFIYAPGGRCVFTDCWRLVAPGDLIACHEHRAKLDAIVMPWDKEHA